MFGSAGPRAIVAGCAAGFLSFALFANEPRSFSSPELAERYRTLVDEIRCLVCQNQSIADSNADLARDLRDKVDELLLAGRSDTEILDYMVARYGNFVRYRPPLNAATAALWIGPFVLAALAVGWLVARVRRRPDRSAHLTEDERSRLALLSTVDEAPDPRD